MKGIAAKLDDDLHDALTDFAQRNSLSMSEAIRLALSKGLANGKGGLAGLEASLEDRAYLDGLRRAEHKALKAVSAAIAGILRDGE